MSRQLARRLEDALRLQGLHVTALFEAAEDPTVDDEISFFAADGHPYPVSIQLGSNYASVGVKSYDAEGSLDGITPGPLRNPANFDGLLHDAAVALRANGPIPAAGAPPPRSP